VNIAALARLSQRRSSAKPGPGNAWIALAGATVLSLGFTTTPVHAQGYPTQPIKLVVPFTPGGGTDVTTRVVAEQLGPKLGQTIIVENRPGASAGLAAATVAKEKPNGYTLLVGTATLATNALLGGPGVNFDLLKDFEFVGKMGKIDLLLVVPTSLKINRLSDLVDLMKTQPGKVQFGSPGIGAPAHLGGELLKLVTKSDALHIPYKGESAAVTDLIGGQTTFQFCAQLACGPRIQDGSLKALAVAAKERSKLAPNVPTMAEAGVPGVEAGTWYFIAAPKGTPEAVIKKLNTALNEVLRDEKVKARLFAMGVDVDAHTSPADVRSSLQAEMDKWRPVVKAAGITK
jgi:tripartite-type tricarboxylate transporter receptor subunit TctC